MALMSLTLDKTIPAVAHLLASPLAKYITLAANDCGYSGKAKELIVTYAHPLFLKAHSAASKAHNPSWHEATRAKFADKYWKAMKLEIATLEAIDAWSMIDCLGHHVIASTWVFKCKRCPDGLIKKFKACFCARGVCVCVYLSSCFKGWCFNYAIPIAKSFPPMTSLPYLGLIVLPLQTPGGIRREGFPTSPCILVGTHWQLLGGSSTT